MTVARLPAPALGPSLPCPPPHCADLFDEALRLLALCADAACACGSKGARIYVAGAAGALRHALHFLANERRLRPLVDGTRFEIKRVGTSELLGSADCWDTAMGCHMPDGRTDTAYAIWPRCDPFEAIWLRRVDGGKGLATRGRIKASDDGLKFVDDPRRDLPSAPCVRQDLGRDLVRAGLPALVGTPALAAALEVALVQGSWLHLATGRRWSIDAAGARTVMRQLGSPVTLDSSTILRLAGMIDAEALTLIEPLGWRHLPTPRAD